MRRILQSFSLLALIVAMSTQFSLVFAFENITLHKLKCSKGYMPSTTYAMVIDKYGFSWIGSSEGLFRYDGYDVVSLAELNESGSMSNVWNLFSDGDRLIVRSTKGLFALNVDNFELTKIDGVTDSKLKHIYKKTDGGFLLGTSTGIYGLNKQLEVTNIPGSYDGLSHNVIRSIYEDRDGNLWVGTYNGLNRIDSKGDNITQYFFKGEGAGTNDLILSIVPNSESDDAILWIGTESGLVKFDRASGEYKKWSSDNTSMSNSVIKTIARVNGDLWLGTDMGLNIFDTEREEVKSYLHKPNELYTLCGNQIHKIWSDSSSVTWIVTNNGINYVNHSSDHVRHVPITYMEGGNQTSTTMRSSINTLEGDLWVTTTQGVFCYDDKFLLRKGVTDVVNRNLPIRNCGDIARDRFGRMWIGTVKGTSIFTPRSGKSMLMSSATEPIFESNYVARIVNSNNGYMYISEWGGGLYKVPDDYGLPGCNTPITRLCGSGVVLLTSLNNWLWFASENKLLRLSTIPQQSSMVGAEIGDGVEEITELNSMLAGNSIESLFLHDGVVYCGTKGAILTYTIEDGSCGRIPMLSKHRYIINICKDNYGNLWASDDRMLYRITTGGRITQFPIESYSTMQIITKSSSMMMNNGDIAFGGDNGFILFSPERMGVLAHENRLSITYVDANSRRIYVESATTPRKVELNHDEHNLVIGFSALNYTNSRVSNYKYRLKGVDTDWNYITNERNYAIYTNIASGTYDFEIYSDNSNGEWSAEPTVLSIDIERHILARGYFIVLYLLLIVVALWSILYFYTKHLRLLSDLKVSNVEKEYIKEMARSKGSFFTNLSHEIRTPLNLITPTINKVLHDPNIGEENKKLLVLAEENSNRLLRLLNQLLDFRDSQSGDKSPMRSRKNDLSQIMRAIYGVYQSQAVDANIDYTLICQDTPLIFYFDRDKMESIIYNLLSNAFKYTPKGGKISAELCEIDGDVVIEVRNSGVGIAPDELPHIFEKFYRAEYFRDRSEGAGIGLSIVSEFVELHGGKIEVESIPNEVTIFRVTTPRVEIERDSAVSTVSEDRLRIIEEFEEAVNQRDDKRMVLYVDDNSQILEMVSIILSGDYNVITASDGEEGFEKCKKYRPDIVITDIMMPGSDGIALCKMIKSTPDVADTPIIAMTAKSQVTDQIVGVNAGVDAYLTKPINVELIHATIEQMLRRSEDHKRQIKEMNGLFNEDELTSQEKLFMDRIMEYIHANLSDPQLTVEMIAEEMSISNASLYRKVKQMTGVSTNELIKKVRLRKADILMQHNYGNLSEIAYKVGFASPSYFSKCYKVEYGCAPRDSKTQ